MQPHGRSAAASAIAHAASRRRSAGIDVGLEAESFIRAAIEVSCTQLLACMRLNLRIWILIM